MPHRQVNLQNGSERFAFVDTIPPKVLMLTVR